MSKINGHPVMGNEDYLRGYNDAIEKCRWNLANAYAETDRLRDILEQLETLVMDDWLRDMIKASLGRPLAGS